MTLDHPLPPPPHSFYHQLNKLQDKKTRYGGLTKQWIRRLSQLIRKDTEVILGPRWPELRLNSEKWNSFYETIATCNSLEYS